MKNRRRPLRKTLLTDKLQYRLLAFNLSYFLVIVMIFAASLFLPVALELKFAADSPLAKEEAAAEFLALHARAWPPLLIVFLLLGIHSVLVSHRVAGPLQRLRTAMRAVGEGHLAVRVALRKNDYLEPEAEMLNEMTANLERRIRAMQEQHDAVGRLFEDVKRGAERGAGAELSAAITSLGAEIEELRKSLSQFTTASPDRGDEKPLGGARGGALTAGGSTSRGPE